MNWYVSIDKDENVTQGDIFFGCPIFMATPTSDDLVNVFAIQDIETTVRIENVVVMTQPCDLEHDPVDRVLVVPFKDITSVRLKMKKEPRIIMI